MSNAIKRLHHDLHDLHRVERSRSAATRELHQEQKAPKSDRRHVDHVRDAFEDNKKELKGDRKSLAKLGETARDRLSELAGQHEALQEAYDQTVDPVTGMGDPDLAARLAALDARTTQVRDAFDHRIGDKRNVIEKLGGALDRQRGEIQQTRKDIKHERHEVKQDEKRLDHARERVHDVRHRALKHLRPAEYKMGLKQTNAVRRDLGLSAVDHVIRPGLVTGDARADMKRLAAASRSAALGMGGYSSQGLCATGVSRALARLGISVGGNGNEIDNNLPRSRFKQVHISLEKALKIPGCVLTWEHTSTTLGSKYGHTAITWGDGHTSSSDFIETNTTSSGRSGLKIFVMR